MTARGAASAAVAALTLAAGVLTLSACAPGQGAYCATLEESGIGHVLYADYIYGEQPPSTWAIQRINVMDKAGAPTPELEGAHKTVLAYLHEMEKEEKPSTKVIALHTQKVMDAQSALVHNYLDACMRH